MDTEHDYLSPQETVEYTEDAGVKKVHKPILKMIISGFIAGVFIALASYGSLVGAHGLLSTEAKYGLGKFISGIIFTTGLIMVLISGGDLFTGNSLLFMGLLDKKITLKKMLKNWFFVYIGNMLGSLAVVILVYLTKTPQHNEILSQVSLSYAITKTNLGFVEAFSLGILCNILVASAVWMSYSTHSVEGRIWAIFFPIMLFITSGYEHCVANMFYIPFGILLKNDFAPSMLASGKTTLEALANLNINGFIINSLLPVTLGNIIGGCGFVAAINWYNNHTTREAHREFVRKQIN
jgi:Formate/nitrite family of transporters